MNDGDKKKVVNAMMVITSMEGQLGNLQKRGPNAAKEWAAAMARATDDAAKQKLKGETIPGIAKLVKDAKTVLKDLASLYKEGADAKRLAAYPSGKEFRTKAIKLLASTKTFDENGAKFQVVLMNIMGGGLFPSMGNVDVIVTIDSLKTLSSYYNAIRIELAKL